MSNHLRGTITSYTTKQGTRFRAQMPPVLDPVAGRPHRPSASFDTHEEAVAWLIEQNSSNALQRGVPSNATLEEVITFRLAQSGLKESTISSNRIALRYIPKRLLQTPIQKVTQGVITLWVTEDLIRRQLRASTMLNIVGAVSAAFNFASNNGLHVGNPVKAAGARRLIAQSVFEDDDLDDEEGEDDWFNHQFGRGPVWTPEQLRTFLDREPYPYKSLFLFIILQGTRRGETLGLRWEDLDPRGFIRLRENITWGIDGTIFSPTPKGGKRRKMWLDPMTLWGLEAHQLAQETEKAGHPTWDERGWIFTRRRWHKNRKSGWWPGAHMVPVTVTARVDTAAKKLGYPTMGPHGFRRSWATIADDLGVPKKIRRDILGHSPESMTDRYSRSTSGEIIKGLSMVREVIFPDWVPDLP